LLTSRLLVGALGTVGLSAIALLGIPEAVKAVTFKDDNVSVRTTVFNKVGNTTGAFDTEMTELNVNVTMGSGLSMMLRESPTLLSTGYTTISEINAASGFNTAQGTYQIDSYFDLNLEASIDGGQNWKSVTDKGPVRVALAPSANTPATGVQTPNPLLPPDQGGYLTPSDVHLLINQFPELTPFFLKDVFHFGFLDIQRINDGANEHEIFRSTITGTIEPIPEPLTILGSFTAMGFGTFFKRKLGKKLQQEKA
jgi:hypothetical protein